MPWREGEGDDREARKDFFTPHKIVKKTVNSLFSRGMEQAYDMSISANLLHIYSLRGNLTATSLSIALGANPNDVTSPLLLSPLHVCCHVPNLSIFLSLKSAGAKLEARDVLGRTPLHRLIMQMSSLREMDARHLVRFLFVSFLFFSFLLLIHLLIKMCALLEAGAKVDALDNEGNTPLSLMTPSVSNCISLELLVKCGASLVRCNTKGKSVMEMIGREGEEKVPEEMLRLFERYVRANS